MSETTVRLAITNPTGLHARPAVKLTKLAKSFAGAATQVALAEAGPWIDAKSVVKVMALRAPCGAVLFVRSSGEQAAVAVAALTELVRRDFDEHHAADASG